MNFLKKLAFAVVSIFTVLILAAMLLSMFAGAANAATLDGVLVGKNGEVVCVYNSHFHKVYVNKGWNGHCPFNVPDKDLE